MFDSLRSLSDDKLICQTIALIARERTVTLVVLLHLIEIERRKIHLRRGYPSMFVYCTTVLGYSASAASRRIRTARCIARFPKTRRLLASNQVNLSTISQVAKILTPHNSDEVLLRICGKSQREVEAIAAEYAPMGTVPQDRVRTVVVRVPMTSYNRNGCDSVETSVANRPDEAPGQEDHDRNGCDSAKPVAGAAVLERRAMVQFCPSEAFMEKVEQVRHLAAHRLPADASLEQVFERRLTSTSSGKTPAGGTSAERPEARPPRWIDRSRTTTPAQFQLRCGTRCLPGIRDGARSQARAGGGAIQRTCCR